MFLRSFQTTDISRTEYFMPYYSLRMIRSRLFSLWPVVMAVNTLSLLLSRLNFVSQVVYSVLKACKWGEKDWIWVTLMLSSVTPLHFPRPETQGTLSSINEENVPEGLVFVKPNYIHSLGKVRINLSNPFWMCRMHYTILRWKYPPDADASWLSRSIVLLCWMYWR